MYDFSFVKGLSKFHGTPRSICSTEGLLEEVRDILEYEYCLRSSIKVDRSMNSLQITVPLGYSDTKIEWIVEVYKWHLPTCILVQVIKEDKLC